MVEMKDPTSGVELQVPEEQVEKMLAAGFVEAVEKPKRRTRKKPETE